MCGIVGFYNFKDSNKLIKTALGVINAGLIIKGKGINANGINARGINARGINARGINANGININGAIGSNIIQLNNLVLGCNFYEVDDFVIQPIESKKGILLIDCDIYNFEKLKKKYKIKARNVPELILDLFDSNSLALIPKIIEQFEGGFSFAYYSKKENKLILARDKIGLKSIVYFFDEVNNRLAFASEKKALNSISLNVLHLNPLQIMVFDLNNKKMNFVKQNFSFKKNSNKTQLKKILINSVEKRIPSNEFGLLLSGGIDSSLIGKIITRSKSNKGAKLVGVFAGVFDPVVGLVEPKDYLPAKEVARNLGCDFVAKKVFVPELEKELPKIISLIESTDPVHVGVACTIYFATKEASKLGLKVVMSGLGADELFAGYYRFKNSSNINEDCYTYLTKLHENDLYYQNIIATSNNLELRFPFLDGELVENSVYFDSKQKIFFDKKNNCLINKKVLREIAVELNLPEEIAFREKKAAQYGSNFDKAIEFLAKKNGFKSKSDYLNSIMNNVSKKDLSFKKDLNSKNGLTSKKCLSSKKCSNSKKYSDFKNNSNFKKNSNSIVKKKIPIAALLSTGKDSIYAIHLMKKQGFDVRCLIAINPINKDSFMFHSPTIEIAKLQAKALGIKLLLIQSKGEKEKELEELDRGIMLAKEMFGIKGVCSGAILSNYQKERIELICKKYRLKHYAPLWQADQEKYLKTIVKNKYNIIITKIACMGLDEKWLGKKISNSVVKDLIKLNKKCGVNVAGEGGEYETLVLDAPLFKEKISVKFNKKSFSDFCGEIEITSSKLVHKK